MQEQDMAQKKEKLQTFEDRLEELRKNGVDIILKEKNHISAVQKNKLLDEEEKADMIEKSKEKIAQAREIAKNNRPEEKQLIKESLQISNDIFKIEIKNIIEAENDKIKKHRAVHLDNIQRLKDESTQKIEKLRETYSKSTSADEKKSITIDINRIQYELNASLFGEKSHFEGLVQASKDIKNQAFVDHVQENISIRNGKTNFFENRTLAWHDYIYKFKPSTFFLNNGLYIALVIFFIVCIIVAPLSGSGNLLTLSNIFTILEQSSTRMFYALGVAGIILLAGTDLSIGRMVAMGAVVTGLILHPGMNIVTLFGLGPWDFSSASIITRLMSALTLSIILCVLVSLFAGFFSAKLKIHPFISTLATQLIIYGLLFFGTSGTPVGSIDPAIKDMIGGRWTLGFINGELITFPKLIIPAIFSIIVAWFIWNKTTFGKNMYAVGGNAEAASVSGISVFKVTMSVFAMAGVFYGFGAFLEAFRANASAGTGQGYELDAIAACVVGGISFTGGIGRIRGAVVGVIIFTSLTYCLTFLRIDTNLQFVFKGFIIIIAVALDSVKYLQKK